MAIRVVNLGKRYVLGRVPSRTLGKRVIAAVSSHFRDRSSVSGLNGAARTQRDDHIWALRDVSFEVRESEVVGVIGSNGAGKSTLLKILSRITQPTTGLAEIKGRVSALLEVGTGFHPELSGRENIYLNAAILGMRRAETDRKFDEIVAFAELERFIDTPVKHYSSGMYLRLAFAIAAHLEPEILLVDEVLAVGDAAFQAKCLGKMRAVAGEGRTILFVSHNLAAVRSLCSRAILLADGQIAFTGSPEGCIQRYLLRSSGQMPAEIDATALPRPEVVAGDAELRITRVIMETWSGRALVYSGQPLIVRMEFKSSQPLKDVVFGCGVHASDGLRLFECRSVDTFDPIASLPPGRYTLRCAVPRNPLNPGLYSLHVGARCAHKGLDYLPDVMIFRVESSERFGSVWLEAPGGALRIASCWSRPRELGGDAQILPVAASGPAVSGGWP